jgi:hypothetical protein
MEPDDQNSESQDQEVDVQPDPDGTAGDAQPVQVGPDNPEAGPEPSPTASPLNPSDPPPAERPAQEYPETDQS